MQDEKPTKEGPSCACGKSDLYEEWLKQQHDKDDKDSDLKPQDNRNEKITAISPEMKSEVNNNKT
jgi:hypothetical protein